MLQNNSINERVIYDTAFQDPVLYKLGQLFKQKLNGM
jgi:hypothetical protein